MKNKKKPQKNNQNRGLFKDNVSSNPPSSEQMIQFNLNNVLSMLSTWPRFDLGNFVSIVNVFQVTLGESSEGLSAAEQAAYNTFFGKVSTMSNQQIKWIGLLDQNTWADGSQFEKNKSDLINLVTAFVKPFNQKSSLNQTLKEI